MLRPVPGYVPERSVPEHRVMVHNSTGFECLRTKLTGLVREGRTCTSGLVVAGAVDAAAAPSPSPNSDTALLAPNTLCNEGKPLPAAPSEPNENAEPGAACRTLPPPPTSVARVDSE